ncbi:MAG: sensor histidine kinase [Patescibacteria group bacterium]
MKKFLINSLEILKKNKGILYSAVLILAIPLILFAANYYTLSQFEKNFNHLLQTKALMLEKIFSTAIIGSDFSREEIQQKIDQITLENQDIEKIKVVKVGEGSAENKIIASSDEKEVGEDSKDIKENLAEGIPEGVAGVEAGKDGERFWEVVKKAEGPQGKTFLIKTSVSLKRVDQAFQQSIERTYWAIILASLVLILLVTNYIRLNKYVFMYNKIKEVDKMKDDFVSMASHELKTPLTAINGYLEILEDSLSSKIDQEEKKYFKNIKNSSNRLRTLVNDILEVSRLEQGRISFEYSETSVSEVAQKVVDTLLPKAQEKNLKFYLENKIKEGEDKVKVDPDRLEQILINLVGNSIKYTEKGEVKVVVSKESKRVVVAVEDTGIGMSQEQVSNLFGKFYRVKSKETKKVSGTGLGLWITKQLTEQMKGKIFVESIKGKGSRFSVSFPEVSK